VTILILQIFVSLVLVAGAVVLFVYTVKSRTLEHADRLSLAPLDDDARTTTATESVEPKDEIKEEGT